MEHYICLSGRGSVYFVLQVSEQPRQMQCSQPAHMHLGERLADHGKLADWPAERTPAAGERGRFQNRAPHHSGRSDRRHPPTGVQHDTDSGLESLFHRSEWPRPGAIQVDLSRGHATRAELVLQPPDRETVWHPVDLTRNNKATQAASTVGCALWPCSHQKLLGIGDGAEPLLTRKQIGTILLRNRSAGVRSHVAATLDLGEKLRSPVGLLIIGAEQCRKEPVPHGIARLPAQRPCKSDGADGRAGMTGFTFQRQQIQLCRLLEGSSGGSAVRYDPAVPDCGTGLVIRRVKLNPFDPVADLVVTSQFRQVGVLLIACCCGRDDANHLTSKLCCTPV